MTEVKESVLVTRWINRIRALDCPSWARKVHANRYTDAGEPDIDAVVCGIALKLEAKVPGGKPTQVQLSRMRKWEASGAVVGVVTTDEELQAYVDIALRMAGTRA